MRAPPGRRARHQGFTLLEVLAVVFLTTILFGAAVTYYTELSTRSRRAAEVTGQWRRATALLDRVAADLERAFLVAIPADQDPNDEPWLFLAEARYAEGGADQLKFIARRRLELATEGPRSDLGFVSYIVRSSDEAEDAYELLRWSAPGLPASLDRDLPTADESFLVADGLASFKLRFQDSAGSWHDRWDSSLLEHSRTLPSAAEIEVAFAAPEGEEEALVPPLKRFVSIPMPALDLEALTDPEAGGQGEGGDGDEEQDGDDSMACDCVDTNARDGQGRTVLDLIPGSRENASQIADRLCEIPWSSAKQFIDDLSHPGILCN